MKLEAIREKWNIKQIRNMYKNVAVDINLILILYNLESENSEVK